jgi:hypothetical protein
MVIHTNYYSVDDVLCEHSHFEFYLEENLIFFNADDFSVIAVFCLTLYNSLTFLKKVDLKPTLLWVGPLRTWSYNNITMSSFPPRCHLAHKYLFFWWETGFNHRGNDRRGKSCLRKKTLPFAPPNYFGRVFSPPDIFESFSEVPLCMSADIIHININ